MVPPPRARFPRGSSRGVLQKPAIGGVGAGILFSLTNLADSLEIETIWGEATASSARFYEKVLRIRPVKDLFIIRHETMRRIQNYYREKQRSALAKINNPAHLS